jgi:hypothetical protein
MAHVTIYAYGMAKRRALDTGRVNEVRRIFQKLYPNATFGEVSAFYTWLEENGRDLLPDAGDQFQQLQSDLQGLWGNPPKAKPDGKKRRS